MICICSFSEISTHNYNRVATVRAALEVKHVFEQLAEAEKGGATPEQRKKLEEQAAEKVRASPHCLFDWLTLWEYLGFTSFVQGKHVWSKKIFSLSYLCFAGCKT